MAYGMGQEIVMQRRIVRDVSLVFIGGAAVYVAAACGNGGGSGLFDGAVRDANAQTSGPITVTAPCNAVTNSGYFAEAAFPGKSVVDLSSVTALVPLSPDAGYPPGYTNYAGGVYPLIYKAGGVALFCGADPSVMSMQITFVMH
jgi:hypothetical protein